MLHYSTRDIITRARELADLENSNFITWAENMKLLDECYKKLYQESINANDKYYLTKCETKDLVVAEREERAVSFYLPEDFYQLQSISVKGTGRQILKKAKTEDNSSARYDIINNTLILYGGTASLPLEIAYYPVPKTLTLKNSPVTVSVEGTPLDVNGDMMLYLDGNGNAVVENINTGWKKSIDITSIDGYARIGFGMLGLTKFFLVIAGDQEIGHGYLCDIKTGDIEQKTVFMGKKGNMLCYANAGWETSPFPDTVTFKNEYGQTLCTRSLNGIHTLIPFCFTVDDDLNLYWLSNDHYLCIVKVDEDSNVTEVIKLEIMDMHGGVDLWKSFQIINGKLFYQSNSDIYCDGVKLLDGKDYSFFVGFNKMDFDTGYGFAVTPLYEENTMQIHSCFADTELDFPNNFYFSYLAYLMAIAYKQKQNADATMLIQRANDEYAQFLTSISRDVAENNRIQNVYGGGTYYYG